MNAIQQYRKAAIEEDFFRLKQLHKGFNLSNNQIKMFLERSGKPNRYYYLQLKAIKEQDMLKILKSCIAMNKGFIEFDYRQLARCVSVHHLINIKTHITKYHTVRVQKKGRANRVIRRGLFLHMYDRQIDFRYKQGENFLYDVEKLNLIFTPFE